MTTAHVNDPAVIDRLLDTPATWAVVGLSTDTSRPAHSVAAFLRLALHHTVVPVHPMAQPVFGETAYRNLAAIPDDVRIDVVDCFVSSRVVGRAVDEAIAHRDRLGISAVWLQLDIVDEDAAARATAAGLDVVMDTCPRIEARTRGR